MDINKDPFACTWLQREDRTARVHLTANRNYWDSGRGPRLEHVIFHNDVSPQRALELVCDTEGEVDIVTEVSPADAERVKRSKHAKLVSGEPMRAIVGILNRNAGNLPLHDARARRALNHAINRDALVRDAMFGHAKPLGGLTPPSVVSFLHRLSPYAYDEAKAAQLWREAGGTDSVRLRIAAPDEFEALARQVAGDLQSSLGLLSDVRIFSGEEKLEVRRKLANKQQPRDWDILIFEQSGQVSDAPPLEFHRAFAGETGEFRAGPIVPEFESLYQKLVGETSPVKMALTSHEIDRFVYDEALVLFLCAPEALYAVNKHVTFTPYKTSFDLTGCKVDDEHWSRRVKG